MTADALLRGAIPLLEATPDGSVLEPLLDRDLRLSDAVRCCGLLVCGGSYSDRLERVLHPIVAEDLARQDSSMVIVDTSGELGEFVRSAAPAARGDGAQVLSFIPNDPARSTGYNPLAGIHDRHTAIPFVRSLIACLGRGKDETPFWRESVRMLLTELIVCAVSVHPERATLGHIRGLIEIGADAIGDLARAAGSAALAERVSYLREAANGQTTLMEALMALSAWQDPNVCAVTGADELRVESVVATPTVLIVHVPRGYSELLHPVVATLIGDLVRSIGRRADAAEDGTLVPRLSIVISDVSEIGPIEGLGRHIESLGRMGVHLTVAASGVEGIAHAHGAETALLLGGLRSRAWVTPLSDTDAAYVSSASGEMAVEEAETADGYQTTHVRTVVRKALMPHELRAGTPHPEYGPAVAFFIDKRPPFLCFLPRRVELRPTLCAGRPESRQGGVRAPLRSTALRWDTEVRSDAALAAGACDGDALRPRIERAKAEIGWDACEGAARRWWAEFEHAYRARPAVIYRVADEVRKRKGTIEGFHQAYRLSRASNIQAVLHYYDFVRVDQADRQRRSQTRPADPPPAPDPLEGLSLLAEMEHPAAADQDAEWDVDDDLWDDLTDELGEDEEEDAS